MKKLLSVTVFLTVVALIAATPAAAQNVQGAPTGVVQCLINGVWTPVHGNCPVGSGGGNGGVGAKGVQPTDTSAADAAATDADDAMRRQKAAEQQKAIAEANRRALEEAQHIAEQFNQKHQDVVHDLDAFDEEPDPPVVAAEPAKPACEWGHLDTSGVDLRCLGLDPDKPIAIDPHVVRGQQRLFSAQIDPRVFQNAHYNAALQALALPGSAGAAEVIQDLNKAQAERPNDPLIRTALLLAHDIFNERKQREDEGALNLYQGVGALMAGDVEKADGFIKHAVELNPNDKEATDWAMTMTAIDGYSKTATTPEKKNTVRLVGNALFSESCGDYQVEIKDLEAAARLVPGDHMVTAMLDHARFLANKYPPQ